MSSTEPSEESDLGPTSTGNGTEVEGGEEGESITAALKSKSSSEIRVFSGLGRSIEVYREPLMVSVACYHEPYYPEDPEQDDPLTEFGGVRGEILSMDPSKTVALRDALVRYDKPHRQFEWDFLGQLI
jgi:hypothetical protein